MKVTLKVEATPSQVFITLVSVYYVQKMEQYQDMIESQVDQDTGGQQNFTKMIF